MFLFLFVVETTSAPSTAARHRSYWRWVRGSVAASSYHVCAGWFCCCGKGERRLHSGDELLSGKGFGEKSYRARVLGPRLRIGVVVCRNENRRSWRAVLSQALLQFK